MGDYFSKQSNLYARYRPSYPEELYRFIFNHLRASRYAWDCATGNGQVAIRLAEQFDRVWATDISSRQMEYAPDHDRVRYREEAAEATSLPDNHFDLVTVAQAIHWFDLDRFYAEASRTARPGALLAAIGYGMVQINERINPLLNQLYKQAFDPYFPEVRRVIDEHYQSLPFPFDEIEVPLFYRHLQWGKDDLKGFIHSWSVIQKFKDEHKRSPAEDLLPPMLDLFPEDDELEVIFPVFMRLGRIT